MAKVKLGHQHSCIINLSFIQSNLLIVSSRKK